LADMAPRNVAESRSSVVRLMVPTDANFMGNVFGGQILSEVDRVAYISARRHSGQECVTASFDRVDFIAPVHVGDVVEFAACLTFAGRTSMEVWVEIRAEDLTGGAHQVVGNAYVTMVAVDRDGRPVAVRPLTLTTPEEKARFDAGQRRMQERQRTRGVAQNGSGR
jgi:acyl-CoA hydrolase